MRILVYGMALLVVLTASAAAPNRPNIVIILADDIGYGDLGCYGGTKIKTPNCDQLAAEGIRFTQGYATAATCTPSRFALLTGKYAWRQPGAQVLPGDAPLCIPDGTPTIASVLKQAGYATGVVGKWHLGLGRGDLDYNKEIGAGPRTLGFDYSFVIPATGDRVPCVYVENHKTVNLDPRDPILVCYEHNVGNSPTAATHPELMLPGVGIRKGTIVNGHCRIGFMSGGKSALWKDDEIADTLTRKGVEFIKANKDRPFFLYFATHDSHLPLFPHPRFQGTSQTGKRGDVIQQFDGCVGELLKTLRELNLATNTLVIVSSDNGAGEEHAREERAYGHRCNGVLRGFKATPYEGGVREPFIAYWPGTIKPAVSEQIVALADCFATASVLAGVPLPDGAAPDSVSLLPVLLDPGKQVREQLITQSGWSDYNYGLQIREGRWKLLVNRGRPAELYDLVDDPSEKNNVAEILPDIVKRLAAALEKARQESNKRLGDRQAGEPSVSKFGSANKCQ
jgi:arylsulfatase A-like enzyme